MLNSQIEYRSYAFLNIFTKTFYMMIFDTLKPQIDLIISENQKSINDRLQNICALLEKRVAHYNWVGFYFSNGKKLLIITISFIFKKFIQTLHAQSFFPFVIFFE